MSKFKKVISILLVVAMCFSLAACSTPGKDEKAGEATPEKTVTPEKTDATAAKVLRYSSTADAPTLDPQLANSVVSSTISYHIYEGLMRNHVGEIQNGMAESYEVSEDGKTYTFHLRDAKWNDGVPVKAQDFEYAFRRLADPATASDYAFIITTLVKNANEVNTGAMPVDQLGIKAIDDKTLTIELQNPTAYFLSMLSMASFCPVRQDLVEKYGKDFSVSADKMSFNGPYIVKDWKHEDRIILEKNPNYWNADAVKLDEVDVLVVSDPNTAVAMYEQGELDVVEVPTELVANYKDQVVFYYSGANDFLKLNMDGSSELKSKDLRLAINYAFNRQDYITLTTQGIWDANPRYVLPQVNGVEKTYGEEYPYEAYPLSGDATKAKEHLAKAMTELGITDPAKIELELLTTDADRTRIEAEVIQNSLQTSLGITVTIKQVPYKQRLEMESNHEFEMVASGWAPDYSDPMTYLELWTSDSSYNHGSYKSDAYDAYIKDARTNTDAKLRMDALFNAEKTLLEDGAIMPQQLRRIALMVNPKVKGFDTYFVGINYDYIYADIEQ